MGTLRIITRDDQPFADRVQAGRLLADVLGELRGQKPIILGIPRGGVVVAAELARELDGEVDIALARKIRSPYNPELAVGSMSEDGHAFVDERLVAYLRLSPAQIEHEKAVVMKEIEQRREMYRAARPKIPLRGRVVVVTDDGLATGATMKSALWAARKEEPARLICAVPVGSDETVHELAELADELVCLRVPPYFAAVGQFYRVFDQTEDNEVLKILQAEVQHAKV